MASNNEIQAKGKILPKIPLEERILSFYNEDVVSQAFRKSDWDVFREVQESVQIVEGDDNKDKLSAMKHLRAIRNDAFNAAKIKATETRETVDEEGNVRRQTLSSNQVLDGLSHPQDFGNSVEKYDTHLNNELSEDDHYDGGDVGDAGGRSDGDDARGHGGSSEQEARSSEKPTRVVGDIPDGEGPVVSGRAEDGSNYGASEVVDFVEGGDVSDVVV